MKRKNKNLLNILIFITFMGVICFGSLFGGIPRLLNSSNNIYDPSLRTSQTITGYLYVNPSSPNVGYDHVYLGYLDSGYTYSFYYDTISPANSIDSYVYLLDDYYFSEYEDGYYFYSEDEFNCYYEGNFEGHYSISSFDEYYLVFEDNDGTYDDYTISYTIYIYDYSYNNYPSSPYLYMMIAVIAPVVIVVIIIIGALIYAINRNMKAIKAKRKTPMSYSSGAPSQLARPVYNYYNRAAQPIATPQSQTPSIIYCRFCGDETTSDATFCPKCGSKL